MLQGLQPIAQQAFYSLIAENDALKLHSVLGTSCFCAFHIYSQLIRKHYKFNLCVSNCNNV